MWFVAISSVAIVSKTNLTESFLFLLQVSTRSTTTRTYLRKYSVNYADMRLQQLIAFVVLFQSLRMFILYMRNTVNNTIIFFRLKLITQT